MDCRDEALAWLDHTYSNRHAGLHNKLAVYELLRGLVAAPAVDGGAITAPTGQPPRKWTEQEKADAMIAMQNIVAREQSDATPPADAEARATGESRLWLGAAMSSAMEWFVEYDKQNHYPEKLATDAWMAGYAQALRERPAQVEAIAWVEVGQFLLGSVEEWELQRNKLNPEDQPLYTTPPPAVDVAALREVVSDLRHSAKVDDHEAQAISSIESIADRIDAILGPRA